jgi:hypothetical protein
LLKLSIVTGLYGRHTIRGWRKGNGQRIYTYRGPGERRKKCRSSREHGNTMSGKPLNTDRFKREIYIFLTHICGYSASDGLAFLPVIAPLL